MATIVIVDGIKYREIIEETETGTVVRHELLDDSGKRSTPQDDVDAMLVDHEYRLTLLELGVSEEV